MNKIFADVFTLNSGSNIKPAPGSEGDSMIAVSLIVVIVVIVVVSIIIVNKISNKNG